MCTHSLSYFPILLHGAGVPEIGGSLQGVSVISSDGRWEVEVGEGGESTGTLTSVSERIGRGGRGT